jgi:signal transduction histidine kinase
MRTPTSFPAKLTITYLFVLLLVGSTGVVTLLWHDSMSDARVFETRSALRHLVLGERLRADVERTLASARGYLLAGDPDSLERTHDAEADLARVLRDLQAKAQTPKGRRLLEQLAVSLGSYRKALRALITAKHDEDLRLRALSDRFERELVPRRDTLDEATDAFLTYREERLTEITEAARRSGRWALRISLSLVLTSVLVAGVVSWRSARELAAGHRRVEASERSAQRAVSAREQLLATVAHDLRSPLSAIAMKAALIRQGSDPERARGQAAAIEHVAIRMEYLLRSLLDAASLEAGQLHVTQSWCDLGGLLSEALELFATLASGKSIRLESATLEDLRVFADRERVLQVLSNLLGNAVKFTPEGGRITVSAARDGDAVRISVSDTGPGIAAEHVPHLFEQFWQTKTGMKRGGAGLGLHIARGIVQAHSGRIWVESEPGRGTTFHFTLPTSEPRGAPA